MKICFTGHRPDKLFGNNINNDKYYDLGTAILDKVVEIINKREETNFVFYFGGELGTDQLAFEWVQHFQNGRDIQKEHLNKPIDIKLIVCVPFEKQSADWNFKNSERWRKQYFSADEVVHVDSIEEYKIKEMKSGEYHSAKIQKGKEYMVDNSDVVIAIWNGNKEGRTWGCIEYAEKRGKKVVYIDPNDIEEM